jgi:hypothetical protein
LQAGFGFHQKLEEAFTGILQILINFSQKLLKYTHTDHVNMCFDIMKKHINLSFLTSLRAKACSFILKRQKVGFDPPSFYMRK